MLFAELKNTIIYFKYDLKYFLHNCRYYRKLGLKRAKERNVLYFLFDPSMHHPGIADRLKGVIALYNAAKKSDYRFKFYYKDPFSLSDYLAPKIDWDMEWNDLEYSIFDTKIINECNWRAIKPFKKNKQYHCYCYAGNDIPWRFEDTGYKWSDLYNELFVPSERLENAYQQLGIEGLKYVSVQLRFVNALEHFENSFFDNHLDTEEERIALINKCKDGIKEIIDENPGLPVYVFSDSKVFLDSLSDLPVRVLDHDTIAHVSFVKNKDAQLKTFLDLYVMSKSQAIYRIKAKELYNLSCFALLASRMGDVKFIDRDLH